MPADTTTPDDRSQTRAAAILAMIDVPAASPVAARILNDNHAIMEGQATPPAELADTPAQDPAVRSITPRGRP